MKLSEKLLKALNQQINMELASGYLYRAMSHDMKNLALNGYAKWLDKQYEEEREHAFNPLDAAKDSLAHEEAVSESIRSLFKMAREEGDLETEVFLQWFITEQIEEEVNARDNVTGFEKAQGCEGLLFMFDAQVLLPLGTHFSFIEMYTPAAGYDII